MQRQMERVNKEENKMMKRKRRQWARRVKCLWVMAFIIKEPDRREMEWSLPSSLLALLFLPCSSRSVCWPSRLYLLWPVLSRRRSPLLRPPSSSRDLLLSSWRRSLICYIQKRRRGGREGAGVGEEAYAKWRLYIERKCKEKFRMERRKKETERRKIVYCKCNHTLQLARRVFKSLSVVNAANRCVATDHRCEKVKQLSLDFFGHIWFSFLQHPEKMDFWYTSSIKKDINTCGFPLRKN